MKPRGTAWGHSVTYVHSLALWGGLLREQGYWALLQGLSKQKLPLRCACTMYPEVHILVSAFSVLEKEHTCNSVAGNATLVLRMLHCCQKCLWKDCKLWPGSLSQDSHQYSSRSPHSLAASLLLHGLKLLRPGFVKLHLVFPFQHNILYSKFSIIALLPSHSFCVRLALSMLHSTTFNEYQLPSN